MPSTFYHAQDVTSKMDTQAADRAIQLTENDALRNKLGDVLKQFEAFDKLVSKDAPRA